MTHVELFPSTDRFGRTSKEKDRNYPDVPQLRGLAALNPLESHVIIDEHGFHSPPQPNYPTLEKELEEAFEAAAGRTKSDKGATQKLQTKTGPTLLTSSNLLTLSPEKTSDIRPLQPLHEKHYIQTEAYNPKISKGNSADTEVTNKSASFKLKEKPVINYEDKEEHYLRKVLNQKQQAMISPIIGSKNSSEYKNSDMKNSGSSFAYAMKPKYQEESIENIPPREIPDDISKMRRIGSRQGSVVKNDPSPLFYFEPKQSMPQITDIPSSQSNEYSSVNVAEQSSSIPNQGETAFEREKRLRDEIKYLKSKLKDLTVKGVGVSPNKLIKAKTKKLKAKTNKIAAKTFDNNEKEIKVDDPTHKRQRSGSKSVLKSREHTPNNQIAKKMSASVVDTPTDIECRKMNNTPIKFDMNKNSSTTFIKRKSSIEDINKKMAKTASTTKIKQTAINKAHEKFFEEYSNKVNENDIKKFSNKVI